MKKLMFGLVALCIAFGLVFSMSAFKSNKNESLYWYHVNSAGRTVGSFAYEGDKPTVVSAQGCKDDPEEDICLFGSDDDSLPNNSLIGTTSEENTILMSEQ